MSRQDDNNNGLELMDRATLSLLSALEANEQPTQRGLAQHIGVALGMTNNLIKRAVRKGLVKIKDVPAKRYAYYVTPKGFSEKSRLVAEYLSTSLSFFRQARQEYEDLYEQLIEHGHRRIAFFGVGELAEIASLSASQSPIELGGVIECGSNQSSFAGLKVYVSVEQALADDVDAIVITEASDPQGYFDQALEHVGPMRVYAVPLLHVRHKKAGKA